MTVDETTRTVGEFRIESDAPQERRSLPSLESNADHNDAPCRETAPVGG